MTFSIRVAGCNWGSRGCPRARLEDLDQRPHAAGGASPHVWAAHGLSEPGGHLGHFMAFLRLQGTCQICGVEVWVIIYILIYIYIHIYIYNTYHVSHHRSSFAMQPSHLDCECRRAATASR